MTSSLNLKTVIGLIVLLAWARPGLLCAELKPEKIYQKVLPAAMTLEVENDAGERFVGTGFLALADDTAVTAWHVLSDARRVQAIFSDGERVEVLGCIDKDPMHDVALLKLKRPVSRPRAELSPTPPLVGMRAYVIGAPRGYDFSISDGLISQIRRVDGFEQYQVSCPISPGNSGGPVLNEDGQVIAVTSWMKTDAQNVSFAVPVREILRLNTAKAPIPWSKMLTPRNRQLAAKPMADSTAATAPAKSATSQTTFNDLKSRLEKSAGKTVTVVIQDGSEESKFTFTIPREGLK